MGGNIGRMGVWGMVETLAEIFRTLSKIFFLLQRYFMLELARFTCKELSRRYFSFGVH